MVKPAEKDNPIRVRGRERTREIIQALDEERVRQGYGVRETARICGLSYNGFQNLLRRDSATLPTLAAFCEMLEVEIILVDKEGRALT